MMSADGAGTLDWIEEPIRDESPEAYEELRKLTPVPFAVGEEFASKWQFLPFIVRRSAFCSALRESTSLELVVVTVVRRRKA